MKRFFSGLIFVSCVVISGCTHPLIPTNSNGILSIIDFEISPDEDKIAFTARGQLGNADIWVVNIDGTGLKKLTFKDRSPSNHLARFFRKHKWRNFYEIDMHSPEWTKDGRIAFCERITKHHIYGVSTVGLRYWTIKPDGTDKKIKTPQDEIVQRKPFDPINRAVISDQSERHKKKIFLKDGILWYLDFGESSPKKLVQ